MVLARMRARFHSKLVVAIGGLIAGICAAQTGDVIHYSGPVTPTDKNRYTVTGNVSNSVTGEPVRRALVHIGQFAVFTGADGGFQIDGVPGGQYSANAQRPGFFDPGQAGLSPSPPMISVGPNTPAAALKLVPESVIEGRVLSNTGEPIEDAQVQWLREQVFNGRKALQGVGNQGTDDTGGFRIENLTPGKYYVRVMQMPVFGFASVFVNSNRQVYPEQYYPNAPDVASAQALELKPGESARLDFTLSPKPAYRVSGVVVPAAPNGIFASLQDADGDETQVGIRFNPRTGEWMLPFVAPGVWNLVFRAQNQPGDAYYGERRIDVRGSDLEKVQIVLQPLARIPVQVLNGADNGSQNIQLRLIPKDARLNRQEFAAIPDAPNANGSLVIRDVTPGPYTVAAQSNGLNCIDSISSGSVDLMHEPLVIAEGSPPAPLQVTLRNDCASLNVTVQFQDHAPGGSLLLVSDSPAFEPKTGWIQGNSASNFSFSGLTPGAYHLYAVSNLNGIEYTNPDALRGLDGQEITLAPNQQATATVTVAGGAANE